MGLELAIVAKIKATYARSIETILCAEQVAQISKMTLNHGDG